MKKLIPIFIILFITTCSEKSSIHCNSGDIACNNSCVTLATDSRNCGTCSSSCPENKICVNGTCKYCSDKSCTPGKSCCGDGCMDLQSDVNNCGACGSKCSGTCCSGVCKDLKTDSSNCSSCGNSCSSEKSCVDGACVVVCSSSQSNCSGSCKDLNSDSSNCGVCGTACSSGMVCQSGQCINNPCSSGQSYCSGTCKDINTDSSNCGVCGTACKTGEICQAGTCKASCSSGLISCSGICKDLNSDSSNCGGCGTTCSSGKTCQSGACVTSQACSPACTSNQTCCNGTCKTLSTDNSNCGSCGASCSSGQECCSGICKSIQTDSANCGTCGNVCSSTSCGSWGSCSYSLTCSTSGSKTRTCTDYSCVNGTCSLATRTETDTSGCGRITTGNSCGLCKTCDNSGNCSNLPSDDTNCGTITCSGLNSTCRTYSDLTSNRCKSFGVCKVNNSADCNSYTNVSSSTSCGTCKKCDGLGSCANTPADDSACGTITCTGLNSTCRTYYNLTSNRCSGFGACKISNSSDCTSYLNNDGTVCNSMTCGACSCSDSQSCTTPICSGGSCSGSSSSSQSCSHTPGSCSGSATIKAVSNVQTWKNSASTSTCSGDLYIGNGGWSNTCDVYRVYVIFNIPSLPAGASISSARFRVYWSANNGATVSSAKVASSWTPCSTNYLNQPGYLGGTVGACSVPGAGILNCQDATVATALQSWVSGSSTNNGFVLFGAIPGSCSSCSASCPNDPFRIKGYDCGCGNEPELYFTYTY